MNTRIFLNIFIQQALLNINSIFEWMGWWLYMLK
jgi:hypothetical protein